MPKLTVITRDGAERIIEAQAGVSLMEALRNHGIDEIQAVCGGCCSCATCHVYVEESWASRLPPMSDVESEMLDCTTQRRSNSRLSCQIPFGDPLNELHVTVAPED
jgi:ferredoxin, 2Fe-2S